MGARDAIRRSVSRAKLAEAKVVGIKAELSHRDDTSRLLWMIPSEESRELVLENGVQETRAVKTFEIPLQEGFGDGEDHQELILAGDLIKDGSDKWWVMDNGTTVSAKGGLYSVQCLKKNRLASGVGG